MCGEEQEEESSRATRSADNMADLKPAASSKAMDCGLNVALPKGGIKGRSASRLSSQL